MTLKSPGVLIRELDESSFIESVTSSIAGYVGKFVWGPAEKIINVSNIGMLANQFGQPNNDTSVSFFSAYNFLQYSTNLKLVRAIDENALNSTNKNYRVLTATLTAVTGSFSVGDIIEATVSGTTATVVAYNPATLTVSFIKESAQFEVDEIIESGANSGKIVTVSDSYYILTYTANSGTLPIAGATIAGSVSSASGTVVSVDSVNKTIVYSLSTVNNFIVSDTITSGSFTASCSVAGAIHSYSTSGILIKNEDDFDTTVKNFKFAARYAGDLGNSLKVSIASSSTFNSWEYKSLFDSAPGANEYHIAVIDVDGVFYNSSEDNVLETYSFVSLNSEALTDDGETAYYKDQINNSSNYIYVGDTLFDTVLDVAEDIELFSGIVNNNGVTDGDIISGYQMFADPDKVDVFYLFMGDHSSTVTNSVISGVVESRLDVVLFASPAKADVLNNSDAANDVVTWGDSITTSNRVFLDSNWKYMYDQYNDKYVWVPMNADTCGLTAQTDYAYNPWVSPMGYTKGIYKNTVRLAWDPNNTSRDTIYSAAINPIFISSGSGAVLLGDRTHTKKPSYFRQLGARRMFIVVEKGIGSYAKFLLGEFNDRQTRASFTAKAESFLRDLMSQGAMEAFEVICNGTNNTEQVIAEQKFRALVRILPKSSINFVELTFSAVSSLSQFEEAIVA